MSRNFVFAEYLFRTSIFESYGEHIPNGAKRYSTVSDVVYLCSMYLQDDSLGPIGIYHLIDGRWLVTFADCVCLDYDQKQVMRQRLFCCCDRCKLYVECGVRAIRSVIPVGANVVFAGFGIGGITMQIVMSNDNIMSLHGIIRTRGKNDSIVLRSGGYETPEEAHLLSYVDEKTWNDLILKDMNAEFDFTLRFSDSLHFFVEL